MMLSMNNLREVFELADKGDASYVFIEINACGVQEVIVIPKESRESKLRYYEETYDNELNHKHSSEVSIIGFSYGEARELDIFFSIS